MVGFLMLNTIVRCLLYVFVRFFKMAEGVEKHWAAVIDSHHDGKKSGGIFKTLLGFSISCMFVYQTLARYRETGSTKDRPRSGCPCDLCTQKRTHAVCECIGIWKFLRGPWVVFSKMIYIWVLTNTQQGIYW